MTTQNTTNNADGRYFGSKEDVLGMAIKDNLRQTLEVLAPETIASKAPRRVLTEFGTRLMTLQNSAASVSLYRMAIAEAGTWPELGKVFYEHGPGCVVARLGELFETWRRRGYLSLADGHVAANQFVGMVRGNVYLQVLLGLRGPPDEAEIDAIVGAAVNAVLRETV